MRIVTVPLGKRTYEIAIGAGLLQRLGAECQRLCLAGRCAIITDSNVGPTYATSAAATLRRAGFEPAVVTVRAGEKSKSLRVLEHCLDCLAEHRLERKSFIVALGGGVVGDLAGFASATFLRGIDFVQVPTTLLAQVDSSVGGKTGVNLKAGKNLVGSFYQPRRVLCDLETLRTLPAREFKAGLAEVIKYGIIFDAAFFEFLEKRLPAILKRDRTVLAQVVARCCEIKAEVVGKDETEGGLRAILNFGHTIGHALEAISGYGKYLHGEAISIGQALAARLSRDVHGLSEDEEQRIRKLFVAAGLPTRVELSRSARARLLAAMRLDKKVSRGEIKFVLARRIGTVEFGVKVPEDLLLRVLESAPV
ncbi:MAG TPA: 3-dehydroquinate synthase [Verrucomicrobiae bacterium]|nr:3-dehydroquinate synthase [Verrucomicrobiae bacterium]